MAKHTKHALDMLMPVLSLVGGGIEGKRCRAILAGAYAYVVERKWRVGVDTLRHFCTAGNFNLTPMERAAIEAREVLAAVIDVAMALKPFEDGSYALSVEPAPAAAEPRPDPFKPGFRKHRAAHKLRLGPRTPPSATTRKK